TLSYDANGNQTVGLNNRQVTWSAFNLPTQIVQGGNTVTFDYDANHERFRQTGPTGTTVYLNPRIDLGGHYQETTGGAGKETRSTVYAGGKAVAEVVTTNGGPKSTRYFHVDHLGSIDAVTDDNAFVLARYDFDPFGNRTSFYGNSLTTRRGFTGHEHVPEVGLIHMNGRMYDAVLGRFISADPTIQFPDNLQSYNRYSYVMNNPLVFTDPSGFGLFGSIGKFFSKLWHNEIFRAVVSIAAAFLVGQVWAPFTSFGLGNALLGGFVGGYIQTGSLQGGMLGALSAGLFYGAGSLNQALKLDYGGKIFTHAIAGCVSAEASGGKCGQGALSAGFAEAAGPFTEGWGKTGNVVAHAVVGGTASALGGGKFANGAITGAYGYLFNEASHKIAHVLDNAAGYEGDPVYKNSKGDAQCVELLKQTLNAPRTSEWEQGDNITKGITLTEGTAIATFVDGKYPNNSTGQHAAIYLGQNERGIIVLEQYKGLDSIQVRTIPWSPKPHSSLSNNGSAYSVVKW
ncbi:MAG: BPSL0067 family protein, partial [Candidatus Methylumidiphilus sp.]